MKLPKETIVANAIQSYINKNIDRICFAKGDKQLNVCNIHIGTLVFSLVDDVEIIYKVNATAQLTFLTKDNDKVDPVYGNVEYPFNLDFNAKIDIKESEEKGYIAQVESIISGVISMSVNPNAHVESIENYYKPEND